MATKKKVNEQEKVEKFMKDNASEAVDEKDLAELAADEFMMEEKLDEEDHWIHSMAKKIFEEYKAEHKDDDDSFEDDEELEDEDEDTSSLDDDDEEEPTEN